MGKFNDKIVGVVLSWIVTASLGGRFIAYFTRVELGILGGAFIFFLGISLLATIILSTEYLINRKHDM